MKKFKSILSAVLIFLATNSPISTNAQISITDVENNSIVSRLSPIPVQTAACKTNTMDLGGKWKFNPAPASDFYRNIPQGWAEIHVPSEWVMQGFSVSKNTRAGYFRTFTLPADWKGKIIKMRCNAVYSNALVYVNGKEVGKHAGGFTPFELDITKYVNAEKENTLALSVLSETVADTLASAALYACHQLGGISRKISLFALPRMNLSSLQVKTSFDKTFTDADLEINLDASNDGNVSGANVAAQFSLTAPDGKSVTLLSDKILFNNLKGTINVPVKKPLKWDNEHPHLYTLTIKLLVDGEIMETVKQKIGFRQIEVKGNELFVNGLPIKLHGINHHEVYPTTGRAVAEEFHWTDVKLFREANVNLLRTSHYPPDESLMNAADSLGIFIECEAPFCWAPGNGHDELVTRQTAEMVTAFRNHPSILFWSLANESQWGKHFEASSRLVRELDPTRPQTFNWMNTDIQTVDEGFTDIANIHYPGHNGPAQARKYLKRPLYIGEDCHLNAYNRLELATDPGLRSNWGRYLREMWDDIYSTKGNLGLSIWAGIDDTFYMPDGDVNGYGTWGPIDGWRRKKPEYWEMKKAYSPVRIFNSDSISVKKKTIDLKIQNRFNFANINEVKINWTVGNQTGTINTSIAPGKTENISIKLKKQPALSDKLMLTFIDPRGFVADMFDLDINVNKQPVQVEKMIKYPTTFDETADTIQITSGTSSWKIAKKTGQLAFMNDIPVSGPQLMILPMNSDGETQMRGEEKHWTPFTNPCAKWECENVQITAVNEGVAVKIQGKYAEANGEYSLFFANGKMQISYQFSVNKEVNPRQIGVVFTLPATYERLTWERKGYWDIYPEDHIGRLKGTVTATEGFPATSVGPRTMPNHPWRLDNLPYGNNDFCSTKNNVVKASLMNSSGDGLKVIGQGKQYVRCWLKDKKVNILVADYSNGGSERFLHGFVRSEERPLKQGDKVEGEVNIAVANKTVFEK